MNKILLSFVIILALLAPAMAESYRTIGLNYIKRVSDKALIPRNLANKDYLQYLRDVEIGAEVLPYDYAAEESRQKQEQKRIKEEKAARDRRLMEKLNISEDNLKDLKEALGDK